MIYVIRHGQTDTNKEKRLQGRSNMPLNEAGMEQAKAAGALFEESGIKFDRVFSSPLDRAVQTGQLVSGFDADQIELDDRLLEMDYGPYEGVSLMNPPAEIIEFFSDFVHNPAPEGMEQLPDVVARLGRFIDDLHCQADENILISLHAISMKGILEYLSPESKGNYWTITIGNCEIYCFEVDGDGYSVPVKWEKQWTDKAAEPGV